MKSLNQLISIFKRLYYQVEKLKKEPLKHLKNLNDDKNKSAKKTSKKILELPEKINEEDIDAMTRNMLIWYCQKFGLLGYSKLKVDPLREKVVAHQKETTSQPSFLFGVHGSERSILLQQ